MAEDAGEAVDARFLPLLLPQGYRHHRDAGVGYAVKVREGPRRAPLPVHDREIHACLRCQKNPES